MDIIQDLKDFPATSQPIALTIGNFDGVHLGHRAVLHKVCERRHQDGDLAVVLTFSNHPTEVLRADDVTPLLCTTAHKLQLLAQEGVDITVILPFTEKLSQRTAGEFLDTLRQYIPFSRLILGYDAVLGKERHGDKDTVCGLASAADFNVEYLDPLVIKRSIISSSAIRSLVHKGDLTKASRLLGRPYSIAGKVVRGQGKGKALGYPTVNLDVAKLCLPPYGVYAATLSYDGNRHSGIANIGIAPTVRSGTPPQLEVFLFDHDGDLYGRDVEVTLHSLIRTEQKFDTTEQLRQQIARDVEAAKALLQGFK